MPWARVGSVPATLLEKYAREDLWDWLEEQTSRFSLPLARRIPTPRWDGSSLGSADSDLELESPEWSIPLIKIELV